MTHPLIATLPTLFRASLVQCASGPWIEHSIRYAVGEAASGQPGANVMAAKIAEMLFVEALRSHAGSLPPPAQAGWPA